MSKTEAANRNHQTLYSDHNSTTVLYADVTNGGNRYLMFAIESINKNFQRQGYVLEIGPEQAVIQYPRGISIVVGEQMESGKFDIRYEAPMEGGDRLRYGGYYTTSTDPKAYERIYTAALNQENAPAPVKTLWNLVDALRRDFKWNQQKPNNSGFDYETSRALSLLEDMAVVAHSAVEKTRKAQKENSKLLRKET